MKKILLLFLILVMFTGCNKADKDKVINISKIPDTLDGISINYVKPFSDKTNVNDEDVITGYGLDVTLLDEYVIYLSSNVEDPSMYMILKPAGGNESVVKYQVKELFNRYLNAYAGYYPTSVTIIENRLEKEYNGYLIYVVSYDNDLVYEKIMECSK